MKFDKLFAGLILVAMAAFWLTISPATVTSRRAEARPVQVTPEAVSKVPEEKQKDPAPVAETPKKRPSLLNMNSTEYRRNLERGEDDPLVLPPLN